jgi:Protein of unknown function (DUF3096)
MAAQCVARGIVPGKLPPHTRQFGAIFVGLDGTGTDPKASPIPAWRQISSSGRPDSPNAGDTAMVITATHIPAIVALIAGILILVMPRLLNFIVAIYLIFIGLVGMGLLKWLHM